MESSVNLGVCFGIGIGFTMARTGTTWRDFWHGIVTLLLILAAFALGTLALDTFGWPLPLRGYLTMWLILVPTALAVGAARFAYNRWRATARRRKEQRPVAIEKRQPTPDR